MNEPTSPQSIQNARQRAIIDGEYQDSGGGAITNLAANILRVAADHEIQDQIWWNEKLEFFVPCNDLFAWGCADLESIAFQADIDLLDQACRDAEFDGPHLYCARKRQMRPQGACYKGIQPEYWALFDACGPVREVGPGNPLAHP